jgi:hypothetical protein
VGIIKDLLGYYVILVIKFFSTIIKRICLLMRLKLKYAPGRAGMARSTFAAKSLSLAVVQMEVMEVKVGM